MARLFVNKLPPVTNEYELKVWLEKQGFAIESIQLILDEGGTSRGFAFAEISDGQLNEAVATLNGARMEGHELEVSEARPDDSDVDGRQMGGTRSAKKFAV